MAVCFIECAHSCLECCRWHASVFCPPKGPLMPSESGYCQDHFRIRNLRNSKFRCHVTVEISSCDGHFEGQQLRERVRYGKPYFPTMRLQVDSPAHEAARQALRAAHLRETDRKKRATSGGDFRGKLRLAGSFPVLEAEMSAVAAPSTEIAHAWHPIQRRRE